MKKNPSVKLFFLKNSQFCSRNQFSDQTDWQFQIPINYRLTIKGKTYYIHHFLKTVANKITASFPFNAAFFACFWYFNNNILSVITPVTFDNFYVSLIQIFRLHFWFLFSHFSFVRRNFYWESTNCLNEGNLWLRNGSFNKILTSKNSRVILFFELRHTKFQQPHDNKKCQSRTTLLD